jgi:nucleoside-diphosphate-sugar epimerase
MRVLVTGSNGFTGKSIMPYLKSNGYEVFGFSKHGSGLNEFAVDLLDAKAVADIIEKIKPDYVLHLAGIALPGFTDIELMYKINMFGTKNLLDAIQNHKPDIKKVIVASTAHVYGITDSTPVKESHNLVPASHYGNSKLATENIARLYMDKLPIIITRPFNYTGKGQSTDYVIAKIVEHYRLGKQEISLGNIDVVRDFSYLDDVLYYYKQLMISNDSGFAVNLCSGVGTSLREVIIYLDEIAGYKINVNSSSVLLRPQDNPVFIGDRTVLNAFASSTYYGINDVESLLIQILRK